MLKSWIFVVGMTSLCLGFLFWRPVTEVTASLYDDGSGTLFTTNRMLYDLFADDRLRTQCLGAAQLSMRTEVGNLNPGKQVTITGEHSIAGCIFTGKCTQWICAANDSLEISH